MTKLEPLNSNSIADFLKLSSCKQKISISTNHCLNYIQKQNVKDNEIAFTIRIPREHLRAMHDNKDHGVLRPYSYVQILNALIYNWGLKIKDDCERINGRVRRISSEVKSQCCKLQGSRRRKFLEGIRNVAVYYEELESVRKLQVALSSANHNAEALSRENKLLLGSHEQLHEELHLAVKSKKISVQKHGQLQSEYNKILCQNKELRDYVKKVGLERGFCNTGKKVGEVRKRQQRRKLQEIKTKIERALWFAKTYGLKLDSANFVDEKGKEHELEFTDGKKKKAFNDLPEDEQDKIKEILFIQDKFCVGEAAYHELTMTAAGDGLPRSYLIKQCKDTLNDLCHIERTPGEAEGAQVSFRNELSKVIKKYMKNAGEENFSKMKKYKVKLSGDGAKMTKMTEFVIVSFSVLNDEEAVMSSKGNHTVAVIKGAESYELLRTSCADIFNDVNRIIKDGFINIDGVDVQVEMFMGGDYKFLLLMMGMKAATSDFACIWCKICKLHRYDMSKPMDFYWQDDLKRTLRDIRECAGKVEFSCQHQPLVDIPLENIVLDELHLMLRITDKLTKNLVEDAIKRDSQENAYNRPSQKSSSHIDNLISAIRSCGVSFSVWEKQYVDCKTKRAYDFTSLMGPDKKILLEKLPSKLEGVISPESSDKVIKIWKDFRDIYQNMLQKRDPTDEDIRTYFVKARSWVDLFTSLDGQLTGYGKSDVTPYMHAMVYHVPRFMMLHRGIKKFTGQGVEKLNDDCRRIHLLRSNKWDAAKDILLVGKRLELLSDFERTPRQYNKRSSQYWVDGIKDCRAKRTRLCRREDVSSVTEVVPAWNPEKSEADPILTNITQSN